jgi:hypothetical protein
LKKKLLCTFLHKDDLESVIKHIKDTYVLESGKLFVFSNENLNGYYCTYNVTGEYQTNSNTISVHRQSSTNTIYTINALNALIKEINNGLYDINYNVNWNDYVNTLLLCNNNHLIKIPLVLEKIYTLNAFKK